MSKDLTGGQLNKDLKSSVDDFYKKYPEKNITSNQEKRKEVSRCCGHSAVVLTNGRDVGAVCSKCNDPFIPQGECECYLQEAKGWKLQEKGTHFMECPLFTPPQASKGEGVKHPEFFYCKESVGHTAPYCFHIHPTPPSSSEWSCSCGKLHSKDTPMCPELKERAKSPSQVSKEDYASEKIKIPLKKAVSLLESTTSPSSSECCAQCIKHPESDLICKKFCSCHHLSSEGKISGKEAYKNAIINGDKMDKIRDDHINKEVFSETEEQPLCKRCRAGYSGITVLNEDGLCFPCELELRKAKYDFTLLPSSTQDKVLSEREERKCPKCKIGKNEYVNIGYADRCFHCNSCGALECADDFQQYEGWEERFDTKYLGYYGIGTWTSNWADNIKDFFRAEISLAEQRILESKAKEVEGININEIDRDLQQGFKLALDAVLNIIKKK